MILKRGKDIKIKVWPDLVGYIPALLPIPIIDKYNSNNRLNIDFQNVKSVNSSGVTLLLINLIKAISKANRERGIVLTNPEDKELYTQLQLLGFYKIMENFVTTDLFWPNLAPKSQEIKLGGTKMISFPVYHLQFGNIKSQRRNCIEKFVDWIFEVFQRIEKIYGIYTNHLARIFQEMAKNSADHSDSDALVGLDFIYEMNGKTLKVLFSFGDFGIGINKGIAKFLENDENYSDKFKHLSLSDAYHYAFLPGNTTKPQSIHNRGLGMSMIFDIAKEYNIKLSVFDANSCGIITMAKNISHTELRKVFYNIGKNVGFYYQGELTLQLI